MVEDGHLAETPAADWGLASLLLGSVLLLMAPLLLLVVAQGLPLGYPLWTTGELRLAIYLMQVAVSFMLLLCVVALVCGLKALRSATAQGRPLGLPTSGAVVCLVAAVLWIMVALGTALIAGRVRHLKAQGLPLQGAPASTRPTRQMF